MRSINACNMPYFSRCICVLFWCTLGVLIPSCQKYLDKKPLKRAVVPRTIFDFQALLDEHYIMNENSPALLELAADDYYITTEGWQSLPLQERLNYNWDPNAYHLGSWQLPYQYPIYYCNVVLEELANSTFTEGEQEMASQLRGAALFYRAFAFHQLAQLYCKPFSASAASDPGIVLRMTGAIEAKSVRSTVQETYQQIIADLKEASGLLPQKVKFATRPNIAAAYGALARTYLAMRDYSNAGLYADSALKQYSTLMDYNLTAPPFKRFNPETIYYSHLMYSTAISGSLPRIDTVLYRSYSDNDLRKSHFFQANDDGSYRFRGSYDGDYADYLAFDGITTDEIYLIRAECAARQNNITAAMGDLNALLEKRWKAGSFVPFTAANTADALAKVLAERRKELVFRGLRWSDLRRFNLEAANITLKRQVGGSTYTLPPNDLRWVMLIPREVISLSGIAQNPR